MLERHVEIGDDPLGASQHLVKLFGEVVGVVVEDADPIELFDLIELAEEFGQPGPAVEIDAVIGHILGHQDQLANAIGGQLASLFDHPLDRLRHMLAAHIRDGTERTEPIASLGDLEVGEVAGCDPQPGAVILGLHRRRAKDRALLVQPAEDPFRDPRDLLAAEDADDLVHLGELIEQDISLPLGQAAGDDDPFDLPCPLTAQQFLDDAARFLPGRIDEPAGIDDDQVGLLILGHKHEPVLRQQPEHPLGVDKILGAAEADERDGGFHGFPMIHRGNAHDETGDSRWEMDSMRATSETLESSYTSGWLLTKVKTRKSFRPTRTISGCRSSKVLPLAMWMRNDRKVRPLHKSRPT